MRLRWGSQLDPKFMLGLAGAYLVLGTAELLLFASDVTKYAKV